jgi:hypothetical protein
MKNEAINGGDKMKERPNSSPMIRSVIKITPIKFNRQWKTKVKKG